MYSEDKESKLEAKAKGDSKSIDHYNQRRIKMKTLTKRAIEEYNPDINDVWAVRRVVDDAFGKPLPAVYGYLISESTPKVPPRRIEQDERGCNCSVLYTVNRILDELPYKRD